MEVLFIFCLTYLPSLMKTTQQLGEASIDIDKNSFANHFEGTDGEFGSIDENENFNRDRLYMDAEEEHLITR